MKKVKYAIVKNGNILTKKGWIPMPKVISEKDNVTLFNSHTRVSRACDSYIENANDIITILTLSEQTDQ